MSDLNSCETDQSASTSNGTTTPSDEPRRIWVGNLDARVNEFQLLKIMQKCGAIDKFDMLFHKGGPMAGHSRGYAFVTFAQEIGAMNALEKLDGKHIGGRPIAVRLAKNIKYDKLECPKPRIEIPALGTVKPDNKYSKLDAIRAIEAKLEVLERHPTDDNLELNSVGGDTVRNGGNMPIIARYQFNKDRITNQRTDQSSRGRYTKSSAPYHRKQR